MEHSQLADFFFVNATRIQNVIYSGGRFLCCSLDAIIFCCQFFSSLFFNRHPIIFPACLFNKYGYRFSFHQSMMKKFTKYPLQMSTVFHSIH